MHTYWQVIIQKGTTNTTELWFGQYHICAGEKDPQGTQVRDLNRLVFSRFFDLRGNLRMLKKNRLEKLVSPVKKSA